MIDAEKYRNSFPILKQNIQLSSCSQSAMHTDVKSSINKYVETWETNGMEWEGWMAVCKNARAKFARLINADIEEIAIVSSVSHAVSAVAASLSRLEDKKKVFITEDDFPCVGHVWLSQKNIDVSFLSCDGGVEPEDVDVLPSDTLLTSVSHVSYYNGFKMDLQDVVKTIHESGSYVFVDAYQSAGQTPIDVKEMDVDFLTAGMQKYLLGIPGIAFLYIKKEIADRITPEITGWFGQSNPFDFNLKKVSYAQGAKRFDSGTFPIVNGYAADVALGILLDIGIDRIEEYLQMLSEHAINYALTKGLIVKSPKALEKKGSNTAIKIDNASEVEKRMRKKGFVVSARNDVIRIAPHFYNTKKDVEGAIDALTLMG